MATLSQSITIIQIIPNGDCALLIRFRLSENGIQAIHTLANHFKNKPLSDLINVIPASDSMVLVFSKQVDHQFDWYAEIQRRLDDLAQDHQRVCIHEIPVCYEESLAADLKNVCQLTNLKKSELISVHTKPIYEATMLGFLPGFVYLSGNDQRINLPRKSSPVVSVPRGSVAVANGQTGLYALSSPGGWHVIGRTPINLFSWQNSRPNLIKPMDQIRFKAIDLKDFNQLTLAHGY